MLIVFLVACALVAVTVSVHAAGIAVLLRYLMKLHDPRSTQVWPAARILILMTWWLILIHLTEISVWGCFYLWRGCLPDAEAAFYFAGVTYTTVGYGDLVLEKPWRLLGPIEGLTGILMCGLSTGFFFAFVNQIYQSRLAHAAGDSTRQRKPP
jgi:hypothetical protein